MSEIGEQLRAAREARGLSLQDVEQKTRIRAKYLAAIEAGDFAALPGDVYVRLFIKSYATFLDLDPAPLLATVGTPAPPLPEPGQLAGQWLSEPLRPTPLPLSSIITSLLVLVVLGALAVSVWWIYPRRDQLGAFWPLAATATPNLPGLTNAASEPLGLSPLATATPTPIFKPTLAPDATATVTPVPTATPPPRVEPTATPAPDEPTPTATVVADQITLAVEALEPAWVWIKADGEQVFMGTLQTGEKREWTGKQTVFLRTGNAGGVRLTLNGQEQAPIGLQGQVVNLTWGLDPAGGPPQLLEDGAPAPQPTTTG